jgi:hypothetical protein
MILNAFPAGVRAIYAQSVIFMRFLYFMYLVSRENLTLPAGVWSIYVLSYVKV